MYILENYHIDYGMEHVVYLMVKKGNRGNREPVAVEHLQLGQMRLSRVTLLEAYLEAWEQPSHVCGVIWDKIKEYRVGEGRRGENGGGVEPQQESQMEPQISDTHLDMYSRSSESQQCRKRAGLKAEPSNAEPLGSDWCTRMNRDRSMRKETGLRELHRYFPDYQVWDRSFQGYLQKHQMVGEWLRVWRVPVYDQYGRAEQLQILLDNVEGWQKLSQIVVLGYDPNMTTWLPKLARRARGIDFYLDYNPRGREEIQEWIDEEYGLVSQWRILGSQKWEEVRGEEKQGEEKSEEMTVRKSPSYPGLSQYLRGYREPCLVLDFTEAADVPVTGLKPGSMWWDMGAIEEKRHLLEDRPLGVRYVSLKTLWRDLV